MRGGALEEGRVVEARAGGRVAGGRPTPAPAATHHPPSHY
jgi:hypothetical protein